MSKILAVAESGFGKTTGVTGSENHQLKGLNPEETYIISATSKDLPGKGSRKKWKVLPNFSLNTKAVDLKDYRRIITNQAGLIAHSIALLGTVNAIKNIVLDDTNYIMQDYYMKKALSTGWDTPKKIGADMGKIFEAMEGLPPTKTFIMLAHGEEYDKVDGRKGYRMKTTGKMVQEFITPEGKFDVLLIGRSFFDETLKKSVKQYVVNDDGVYTSAKSHEIFGDELYVSNDLGYIVEKVNAYYNGD